ncbi:MAG: tRNA (adenosine(37)-N6)-threonylcarbamoyltransferase complex dimerization subunit type 1 TsaB [Fusobacteriia bacterium 4572_132]|nr:MAG: tRNA (adenosine(37)-N6)-threonylcarbamoyltransferase complex dimerization subunit type 1 TsaB [Fusobacteriia bacterium 4572_132]
MLILGIETTTKIASIAIFDSEKGIISEITLQAKINHSDTLMKAINGLFEFSGIKKEEIDKIAVGLGPGSFTGIRVGLGTAKGLAYSLKIPLVGINTLDILVQNVMKTDKTIVPLIDARKTRVYYAIYKYEGDKIKKIEDYGVEHLEKILENRNLEKIIFTGRGSVVYKELLKEKFGEKLNFTSLSNSFLRASHLAELAVDKKEDNIYELEPFYLSKSQAERMKAEKGE